MKDDTGELEHLRVVLCVTEDATTSWFIVVNLTTVPQSGPYDDTCVLEPGIEEYITKRCYVYYEFCKPISKEEILDRINQRRKQRKEAGYRGYLKPTTFWQIYDGALESLYTSDGVIETLTRNRASIASYIQELEQD